MQRRGIRLETTCPFCASEEESQVHLFFHCPFIRVFWLGSPLQLDVTKVVGEILWLVGSGYVRNMEMRKSLWS